MHRKVDYSQNGIFCLVNELIFVRDVCSFKMEFIQQWQQMKFDDANSTCGADEHETDGHANHIHGQPSHGKSQREAREKSAAKLECT